MTALGVALLVIGAVVVLIEAHYPTLGILGGPGVLALALGSVFTVAGLGASVLVGVLIGLLLAAAAAGVLTISLKKGMAVRRRRVRAGPEGLLGRVGVVRSWSGPTGSVLLDGALWHARQSWREEEAAELHEGDSVVVERLRGLTLSVRRAEEWELVA